MDQRQLERLKELVAEQRRSGFVMPEGLVDKLASAWLASEPPVPMSFPPPTVAPPRESLVVTAKRLFHEVAHHAGHQLTDEEIRRVIGLVFAEFWHGLSGLDSDVAGVILTATAGSLVHNATGESIAIDRMVRLVRAELEARAEARLETLRARWDRG